MTSARTRGNASQYGKTSDDEDKNLQATRTYPAGQIIGNEEVITRRCIVTDVPQKPGSFEASTSNSDDPFPTADATRTIMTMRLRESETPPSC